MGQQSEDPPITETIRKDIDKAMTGTQIKPRAVPRGTQTEQEAVLTGTQTRKETGLPKTVSGKIHVIPFVGSHSNVVTGKLFGKDVKFLCDTGATISILNEAAYRELCKQSKINLNTDTDRLVAKTVNGQNLQIHGKVMLNFKLGSKGFQHTFYVTNTNHPAILGFDFLTKHQAKLDCSTGILHIKGQDVPLGECASQEVSNSNSFEVDLVVSETVTIEPWTKNVILVDCDHPDVKIFENKTGIVQPKLPNRWNMLAGDVLTKIQNTQVPVLIVNPGDTSVTMHKKTKIGRFSGVNDVDICSVQETGDMGSKPPNLNINLDKTDLNPNEKEKLTNLIHEFSDIFAEDASQLGRTSVIKHHIDTGDHHPVRQKPYRVSPFKKGIITEHVKEMAKNNIIRPSCSPWSSPIVLVGKRSDDGAVKSTFKNTENVNPTDVYKQYRPCIDYRYLNLLTKKDSYRIPRIDDTLDALSQNNGSGPGIFTTLDMFSGYFQIELDEKSKEKTAFSTPHMGLWEFNVMPFGLTNAPSTYQRLMESLFRGLVPSICLLYIDDLICHSMNFEDHLGHLRKIFEILRVANLKLKLTKCNFAQPSVKFLGHIVSKEGIKPDPNNIKVVRDFKTPTKVHDVQSWLGLANYYRKFVKNFSEIAKPLTNLLKKGTPFIWDEKCDKAFTEMKQRLIEPPLLGYPSFDHPFTLYTDASGFSLGAVLSQQIGDQPEKVIAYAGRDLKPNELKYSTTEKECLALVDAVKRFSHYLEGRRFTVVTDHHSLKWLMQNQDNNSRLQRWALRLQAYDFEITYRPGRVHQNADTLSRTTHNSYVMQCDAEENVKLEELKRAQVADSWGKNILQYLVHGLLPNDAIEAKRVAAESHKYVLNDGVLYYVQSHGLPKPKVEEKLYVPKSMRHQILEVFHDNLTGRHLSINKVYPKLAARYFWPGMYAYTKEWIDTCADCATKKTPTQKKNAPLVNMPAVSEVFERVGVDICGPFVKSNQGNKYIIVFTDYLTRYAMAFPLETTDSVTVANVLVDKVIFRFGAMNQLLSDRGSNFLSKIIQETCKCLGIKKINTTSFHPQCNSLTERMNKTLVEMMSMYTNSKHTDWDRYLDAVLFAYNTSVSAGTGFTPFFLMHGYEAKLPVDHNILSRPKETIELHEFMGKLEEKLTQARSEAKLTLQQSQVNSKERYDRNTAAPTFQVGDKVWVFTPKPKKGLTKKLLHFWHGPYEILQKTSSVNYKIVHHRRGNPFLVHSNRLKLCHTAQRTLDEKSVENDQINDRCTENSRQTNNLPEASDDTTESTINTDIVDVLPDSHTSHNPQSNDQTEHTQIIPEGGDIFYIEKILGKKMIKGKAHYLIKWQGFSDKHNTYEPEENIFNKTLILNFERNHFKKGGGTEKSLVNKH